MFVLFRGLAQSYQKNGMIAKGVGRFLSLLSFMLETI